MSGETNAIRTMHYVMHGREYLVSELGEIVRLPSKYRKTERKLIPTKTVYGYLRLCFPEGNKFAHRIVYEAFNGKIPDGMDIDHINGIRDDNSISNLRAVPRKTNALNRKKANANSSSGIRGVHYNKKSKHWVFAESGVELFKSKEFSEVVSYAKQHRGEE